MRYTKAAAENLEAEIGASLNWLDVTQFGDDGPMFVLNTPRCEYCGVVNPRTRCVRCGGPAKGVRYPQ